MKDLNYKIHYLLKIYIHNSTRYNSI